MYTVDTPRRNMKDYSRRIYLSIFWMVLGVILFVIGEKCVPDSFWSGMGIGLFVIGTVQTIRWIKYRKDEEYREKFDTQANDERNRFLSGRAWAWSGYASILIGACVGIVFKAMGRDELSMFCFIAVCLITMLYWIFYMVLSRKY